MTESCVLVTGASGEIGHSLVNHLANRDGVRVVALDKLPVSANLASPSVEFVTADILDKTSLQLLFAKYQFDTVFHLAALLSSSGERNPLLAHRVNVEGSLNLLDCARDLGTKRTGAQRKIPTKFIFPSTIAVYGIPDADTKQAVGAVREHQYLTPITMYGINKLYVENLGRYFSTHYGLLLEDTPLDSIDFRCIRFPGILSADSIPSGGTSDYGPEMIHAAAQGKPYTCFVAPEARLPFLAMPDAVNCLVTLADAPRQSMKQPVYNINGFSISAKEIESFVTKAFPNAVISYKINPARFKIVESWPAEVDESAAQRDWGWKPQYTKQTTFTEYLIPLISKHYQITRNPDEVTAHAT